MKFKTPESLSAIADFLDCSFVGDANFPVLGLNEIHRVGPGDIVFVDHPKYYDKALNSAATIILINQTVECPENKALLISEDPLLDFNRLIDHFFPEKPCDGRICSTAKIGEGTVVHPTASIGHDVVIGQNCQIHAGVVIYANSRIGDNVILHGNTTIGADPFYFQKRGSRFVKLSACGYVDIEDNVELGANCTIDRGLTDVTRIGSDTKFDAQIHIGHDVRVGSGCLMAAQVGVSGYTIIEEQVTLWGKVGVASNLTIGANSVVMGDSVVTKSLPAGGVYMGAPAIDARKKRREMAKVRRLVSDK